MFVSNKNIKIISVFALLTASLYVILFIPRKPKDNKQPSNEIYTFLNADSRWADSLMKTLSIDEKINQLLLAEVNCELQNDFQTENQALQPSGIIFKGYDVERLLMLQKQYIQNAKIPLFNGHYDFYFPLTGGKFLLDDTLMLAQNDAKIKVLVDSLWLKSVYRCGFNFFISPNKFNPEEISDTIRKKNIPIDVILSENKKNNYRLIDNNILFCSGIFNKQLNKNAKNALQYLFDSVKTTIVEIHESYYTENNTINFYDSLNTYYYYKGILYTRIKDTITEDYLERIWASGVHLINCRENYPYIFKEIKLLYEKGIINEQELNRRVYTILLAKSWMHKVQAVENELYIDKSSFYTVDKQSVCYKIFNNRLVLIHDKKNILPLKQIDKKEFVFVSLGKKTSADFFEISSKYTSKSKNVMYATSHEAAKKYKQQKNQVTVILLNYQLKTHEDSLGIIELSKNTDAILINNYYTDNLHYVGIFNTLLHLIKPNIYHLAAYTLFGAQDADAVMPFSIENKILYGQSKKIKASRIGFCYPEEIGINSDSLRKIDYIMEEGVRNRAFPGGLVLFAKDGKIFYHKSFGSHQYTLSAKTEWNHLYDMASVTKVAATTLMGMHLYDLGKYNLNDSLYHFFPDTLKKHLKRESAIRNITFKELLIHQSGLPSGHNIIRFIRFTDSLDRLDKYFCDEKSAFFSTVVADSFYLGNCYKDTLWMDLHKIWVEDNKTYRYSDANMNVLQSFYASMIKNKWHRYLDSVFYKPMGMKYTCYLPLKQFEKNRIAPTENDKYWRKQLVHGHVHDPTAALYGGIAGNAGLFSCAYDMAVLCQMFLNKGYYGGEQIIKSETLKMFTSKQEGTHRGLGFNMQVKGNTYGCSPYASDKTYGHTGFTGTAVWVDPEINLIYVFISNRVHPDVENKKIINLGTTKRIHTLVYEQLLNINENQNL